MEADAGAVYTSNFHGVNTENESIDDQGGKVLNVEQLTIDFIMHFRLDKEFPYVRQIRENLAAGLYFIEIMINHIQQFHEGLFHLVEVNPTHCIPRMENALQLLATEMWWFALGQSHSIQLQLFGETVPLHIRDLARSPVARLICVGGMVVKSSPSHARCTRAAIQCTSCRSKTFLSGARVHDLPPQCMENIRAPGNSKCRPNPYVMLPMESEYEDQQVIKLQELPEDVPTGELPRQITVLLSRYLVDRVSPGARVHMMSIVSVQERASESRFGKRGREARSRGGAAGLRCQFLRCVGIMTISTQLNNTSVISINRHFSSRIHSRSCLTWDAEDEIKFNTFSKSGNVYELVWRNIDPAIYGVINQKKAIACLLFGGTRKRIGNNFLRGDINVLFIGDPSTAKSQLLKYTEKIAPIGIYTSGKGSSAAGLTASVLSSHGEFVLEAGSMVLADGGVVCIDEFDKMREQDQVAIHEAMEQQTISIAKANLTTMLNSRTSVLAAANPSLGYYDPSQSNEDQMDFQGSILSRFDLIFKIIDPKNPEMDYRLAKHVIELHKQGDDSLNGRMLQQMNNYSASNKDSSKNPSEWYLDRGFLTKYISYARSVAHPHLSEEAMQVLLDYFVKVRKEAHEKVLEVMSHSHSDSKVPLIQITARQLESLVRLAESLARMRLEQTANVRDAQEAIRLFNAATIDAIESGFVEPPLTEGQAEVVLKIEELIRRRIVLGTTVEYNRLHSELVRMGFDIHLLTRALNAMTKREELVWRKQRTLLHRLR